MFESIKTLWNGLDKRARVGVAGGIVVIVIATILLALWALRGSYDVLFADLEAQDAATIVGELEKMKVPYRLADDGTKILVEEKVVHATRLKLMGKGIPLQGGVGFEVFDNSEFGMTEFAQKINLQRALQGELARTITALPEVKFARVHLVMPETSIFKQNKLPPKASVTLILKEGRQMSGDQISGVQRLVAAAVPGLDAGMVTVLDQRGVTLTAAGGDEQGSAAAGRLGLKKEVETYLTRKVAMVLDRAFGPGQAIVSVDVTLNLDQVKTTQEDVVPITQTRGEATGAISRKRLVSHEGMGALRAVDGEPSGAGRGGSTTTEVEYQLGRKIEQVVSTPGSIRRLSVGVLVPQALDEGRLSKLREVVAMAVGLNPTRGDAIALTSLDQFAQGEAPPPAGSGADVLPQEQPGNKPDQGWARKFAWTAALVLLLVAVGFAARRRREAFAAASLTAEEREALLRKVKGWIGAGTTQAERQP